MDSIAHDAGAVTAVIGYTQVVRARLPEKFHKYMVFVSCAIGMLYAVSIRPGTSKLVDSLISGTMIGLAASGGFAGMKSVAEALPKRK